MPLGPRKRVKPSPSGADSPSPAVSGTDAGRERSDSQSRVPGANWYPASWSAVTRVSKAAPVTEVARESISVAKNVASSVTNSSTSLYDRASHSRHPSIQLTKKAGASTRSLPAGATTTKINIASDGSASTTAVDKLAEPDTGETDTPKKEASNEAPAKPLEQTSKEQEFAPDGETGIDASHAGHAVPAEQPGGWFSWFNRPAAIDNGPVTAPTSTGTEGNLQADNQVGVQPIARHPPDSEVQGELQQGQLQEQATETVENSPTAQKRSWLQMWYGASASAKRGEQPSAEPPISTSADDSALEANGDDTTSRDQPDEPTGPSRNLVGTARSTGWSFWTKDPSKDATPDKAAEVQAIEASIPPGAQSRPMALEPDPEANVKITKKDSIKMKAPKNNAESVHSKDGPAPIIEATSTSLPPAEPRPVEATASKQLLKILPNQVLPRVKETYMLEESPSILQSLGRLLHYSKAQQPQHVCRTKDMPRIKRALSIGVHGYFPAPLIRSVFGQPTGTSIRFSNMAAEAIQKWTEGQGYSCEVEKIALEGEGRISERVDLLWKLLLNWMEKIRSADFIMISCHSQGVPVAIMLVAKLISFGCLNAARVGICAMAGINLGPFPSYRSRWISGSAGELFEFALPFSQVSKDYEAALRCALDFGVRISYIGSIDDQLVSLESSLFSPIAHPYIFRAVFVDGRVHAPSFLSHLVGFALKLRNLGISDHGLIRELSQPLAGSLYTGEGHSRLYDDEAVYDLAIEFALETSSVSSALLNIKRSHPAVSPNPYILPFAMRGLLEEEYVRRELHDETMELLKQFDDWKPVTKVLKDVKFRLEGIRSKL
ncbi:hypothetical protein N7510_004611 [Penicillium lagena]|uniref:uncharacterized protein n=1 Tax=Penicillium lagena TaxID=94218 RepID=UPI002540426A|nr:uncharacterized protein N7510_004611 [Penicillium lagena]KAJ5620627.1 hypothetical protein N7510_004611 [Penicillium lagena]